MRKFDTLEEVADFYEIPVEAIRETINRFNENFKEGVDKDFGKPLIENSSPICEAPYYAMRLWPKVHFTMGGIRIDADARVISIEGDVIEGLYAAGEVTGGVHGASRLGSCAITECLVFGKIAGENIVNQSKI